MANAATALEPKAPESKAPEAMGLDRPGEVDFQEFCVVIRPDQKADLLDGVIWMASPESLRTNDLFLWLAGLFREYVRGGGLGKVFGSRVAFRLDDRYGPEPDVAFVRADRLHLARKSYFDGPPDLAVEIVSPESVRRDYVVKRDAYRAAGVREYWIIDEPLRRVTVHRLDAAGGYVETSHADGELRSSVLDGLRLDVAWLWLEDRPSESKIVADLLQERTGLK